MKNIFFSILLSVLIPVFTGCGVVLDTLRIEKTKWSLSEAFFYAGNSSLDSTNTYSSTDAEKPTTKKPILGQFFRETDVKKSYMIEFTENYEVKITGSAAGLTDAQAIIVSTERGEWAINQYNNSLIIHIRGNEDPLSSAKDFWRNSFTLTNVWPMTDYNTLEITIRASDVGNRYFDIELSGKTVRAGSMKGVFKKQ